MESGAVEIGARTAVTIEATGAKAEASGAEARRDLERGRDLGRVALEIAP